MNIHACTAYIEQLLYAFFAIDFLIVGSDSGRIVILDYNPQKNVLEKVSHR